MTPAVPKLAIYSQWIICHNRDGEINHEIGGRWSVVGGRWSVIRDTKIQRKESSFLITDHRSPITDLQSAAYCEGVLAGNFSATRSRSRGIHISQRGTKTRTMAATA